MYLSSHPFPSAEPSNFHHDADPVMLIPSFRKPVSHRDAIRAHRRFDDRVCKGHAANAMNAGGSHVVGKPREAKRVSIYRAIALQLRILYDCRS